jgi:hypothetical protein
MGDMMIPFVMLLIVTIALILERKYHENDIVNIYEKKFQQWKKHTPNKEVKRCKELVGLVFMENNKLDIEVLDNKILDKLERKKYNIKTKG